MLEKDIERVLVTKEELQEKITELGAQITKDYEGEELLVIGILRGSVLFMTDLIKAINLYMEIDFMDVSSYGEFEFTLFTLRNSRLDE
ncbi:hypothetical protein CJ205_07910 [Dolosicoccus paucivorans]|uniref:Hypoxanthine-guanine phosphoribosyltransferase n=1 Tax=Dolosicoccus paucivorans TaxID=84521 RepID=A0A2N6SKZ8_9LACT|nr:phosphoribosyltransferase family protein [Dolosicoccus paucivorans]PMC57761.1 hypothetical protein CJ205_07910 [Dolosicoccus paucivorans]